MGKYREEILAVLHHINQQVQKDWTGSDSNDFNAETNKNKLVEIARMSLRNFQLYFKALLHESYGAYIKRVRLEHALQLLQDGDLSITEISERIGYANDTALYNAIKKKWNKTPNQYKTEFEKLLQPSTIIKNYRLEDLEEKQIFFLSYFGDYDNYSSSVFEEESWDKLYDYAYSLNLLPDKEEYWGICYDNKEITDLDKCRFYGPPFIKCVSKNNRLG